MTGSDYHVHERPTTGERLGGDAPGDGAAAGGRLHEGERSHSTLPFALCICIACVGEPGVRQNDSRLPSPKVDFMFGGSPCVNFVRALHERHDCAHQPPALQHPETP
jgi:hypothetical protein